MESLKEIVKELNELLITQKHSEWMEDLPTEVYEKHFKEFKWLSDGLFIDTHRWYETSVSVVEIYGKPLGVKHITNLFSEQSTHEDCFVTIEFYEMEEITIPSYKILK